MRQVSGGMKAPAVKGDRCICTICGRRDMHAIPSEVIARAGSASQGGDFSVNVKMSG